MNTRTNAAVSKNRYKVNRGEAGCHVVTKFEDGDPVIENLPVALASPSSSLLPIPARYLEISHLRASLILGLKEHLSKRTGLIGTAVNEFHKKFNAGLLLPNIYEKLGSISVQSLYRLKKDFNDLGIDGLIPGYGGAGRSKISDHEKNLVLTLLLHQNRLKIAYGITLTKEIPEGKASNPHPVPPRSAALSISLKKSITMSGSKCERETKPLMTRSFPMPKETGGFSRWAMAWLPTGTG